MITVVIATYNGTRYLPQQLESIAAQSLSADEVIISDDCSTDDTVGLCHAFIEQRGLVGWRVLGHTENVGYCRNFYRALDQAQGDIIFFCDQDDVWDSDKLRVMVGEMEKYPEIKLLASRYRLIDGAGEEREGLTVPHYTAKFDGTTEPVTAESLIGHSHIRGCSMCIRKELKEHVKPIELKDLLGHDWLLAMLASLDGSAFVLNAPLMSYRCHDSNASFSARPVRRIEKRIAGLLQSLEGHEYILSLSRDERLNQKLRKFTAFEQKRLEFLKTRNFFRFLELGFSLKQYDRYYAGGGIKVWLGDFVYAYISR